MAENELTPVVENTENNTSTNQVVETKNEQSKADEILAKIRAMKGETGIENTETKVEVKKEVLVKKEPIVEKPVEKEIKPVETVAITPESELSHQILETELAVTEEEMHEEKDYSQFSKTELVDYLRNLVNNTAIQQIKDDVEEIKSTFYKKHQAELKELRRKHEEEQAEKEEKVPFEHQPDPLEVEFKELLKKYRDAKIAINEEIERQKQANLKQKFEIIERIKTLVSENDLVDNTFNEFKELQARWKEIGQIPQAEMKTVWDTYHYNVGKFYDLVKINKELRDLDLKRNLEAQIELCEKAEELLLEPSIINAFRNLQKLHSHWREIGPVPREKKEEVWQRFKDVTTKINKSYQDHFEALKKEQENNLQAKTLLCEQVEELLANIPTTFKDWEDKAKQVIEWQVVWKTLGFAPKKDNNKIYERFRNACDDFFEKKREFFQKNKDEQNTNMQLKTELIIQAEALKDSTEWKKTTEELIALQNKWKTIGPVPKKHSETLWQRFRAACNHFFDEKSKHFASIDLVQDENLKLKRELIEAVKNFQLTEDSEDNLNKLKEFQKKWTEIGHVPIKFKDEVQGEFRKAINERFESFNVDEYRKSEMKFKQKLEGIQKNGKPNSKFKLEKDKLVAKLNQVENDIVIWENNIGFFAKSKNADTLIAEMYRKIDSAKKLALSLRERIEMINNMD